MADADAAIASFMAITGSADENTARFWVDAAGGNVELAVGNFLDGNNAGGGAAPPPQDDAAVAAALHAREMEHEVRAGLVKRGRLLADFPGADDDEDAYTPGAGAFDDDEDDEEAEKPAGGLSSIFAPPTELTHAGDFQKARADGKAQKKWLLVVITNEAVFACHEMNRDCWSDDTVRAVVEASFILWLRPHADPQASTYCDRYDRDRALPLQGGYSAHPVHPHLAVVDPRTGGGVWTKDGKVSRDRLVELLSDITERHSLEELAPVQVAPRARRRPAGTARRRRGPRRRRGLGLRRAAAAAARAAPPADPRADAVLSPARGRPWSRSAARASTGAAASSRRTPSRRSSSRPGRGEAGRRLRPALRLPAAAARADGVHAAQGRGRPRPGGADEADVRALPLV